MVPIHVINLDRVPERWQFVRDQFASAGLAEAVQRFPAIDARDPTFSAPAYAPRSWRDRWELERSEQAIFESHRALWRLICDQHGQGAVICEDDILVSRQFAGVLDALPDTGFDIIKLDGFSAARRYGPPVQAQGLTLRPILEAVPSAACYYVGAEAARLLLDASQAYCATLDDFVFAPRTTLSPMQLFPAVAVQGMCCAGVSAVPVPDLIGASERADTDTLRRAAKGPTLFRIRKEVRRLATRLTRATGADARLRRDGGLIVCPDLAADLPPYRPNRADGGADPSPVA